MNAQKVAEKLNIDWSNFTEDTFLTIQSDFANARTDEEKDRLGEDGALGEIIVNGLEYSPYYEISGTADRYPILFLGNENVYDENRDKIIENQLVGYSGEKFIRFSANQSGGFMDMDYSTFQELFRKRVGEDIARAIENKSLPRKILNCKNTNKALDLLQDAINAKNHPSAR